MRRLSSGISRYIWYDESARFLVLSNHSNVFLSLQQKTSLHNVGSSLTQGADVDTKASELPVVTDDALHYLTYLLSNRLHFLILKYELNNEVAGWNELAKYSVAVEALHLVVFSFPESVATVLLILRLKPAAPHIVELNEIGLHVPARQALEPAKTPAFPNRSVVYSKIS